MGCQTTEILNFAACDACNSLGLKIIKEFKVFSEHSALQEVKKSHNLINIEKIRNTSNSIYCMCNNNDRYRCYVT